MEPFHEEIRVLVSIECDYCHTLALVKVPLVGVSQDLSIAISYETTVFTGRCMDCLLMTEYKRHYYPGYLN